MQYTSGSLGGLASGWFVWLLLSPAKNWAAARSAARGASRIERIPETVLERVIAPVGGVIMRASAAARRYLQHGRLQAYIVYVVAALLAVGILVVVGGGL